MMESIKKRYVVLAGILAGLAIASQNYSITGWQHLKLQSVSQSSSASANLPTDPLRQEINGWNTEGRRPTPYLGMDANSSLGEHHQAREQPFEVFQNQPNRFVSSNQPAPKPSSRSQSVVRIATFNVQGFGESKLKKAAVVETICRMIRQCDVVALQHIQARVQSVLPELLDHINQGDRHFDYCIGPRVGSEANAQQFAFLFDTDRIETDRQQLYTVDDPQNVIEFEPLVGWFRSRLAPPDEAFTFTLVNVRLDPLSGGRELKLLPDLLRSVRQDGRSEDDVILLGDFGCSDREMDSIRNVGMMFALEGIPTTVTGEAMLDNILFPIRATDEFTGRSGVIDFLRQLNLSIDQAFQVSSHMPVWAEFWPNEGGMPGYVGRK